MAMQEQIFDRFTITVSDDDGDVSKCIWKEARKHWKVIVYDKENRKQMGFDYFGGSLATVEPLDAFFNYIEEAVDFLDYSDAFDFMQEFGYDDLTEAKRAYKGCEKAYYKCRKFIGDDAELEELCDRLCHKINE
jgi:hypothetical protein